MSNYALYMIGYVVLIAGVAYGAHLMGVPQVWILVGAVILLGIGIISGVTRTRRREVAATDDSTIERERVVERR